MELVVLILAQGADDETALSFLCHVLPSVCAMQDWGNETGKIGARLNEEREEAKSIWEEKRRQQEEELQELHKRRDEMIDYESKNWKYSIHGIEGRFHSSRCYHGHVVYAR